MEDKKSVYDLERLTETQAWANIWSTCEKVRVGSQIISQKGEKIFGQNRGVGYNCKTSGCYRKKMYGENSKEHRLPSDCQAVHSEVDVICKAAKKGISTEGATIYVTRYPCEACARAIVRAGITNVVYGRAENTTEMTDKIFKSAKVNVVHRREFSAPDDNR